MRSLVPNAGGVTSLNDNNRNAYALQRLLAIYLFVIGVFGTSLGQLSILTPILAIAAGVCLLLGK